MPFPFEVGFAEVQSNLDVHVDAVFGCLESEFLVMPKGDGFKVTRVQHLGALSMEGQPAGQPRFDVVACIAGRGFGVRREDMKKLLIATRGKVFTLQNMHQLVEYTGLAKFRSR